MLKVPENYTKSEKNDQKQKYRRADQNLQKPKQRENWTDQA